MKIKVFLKSSNIKLFLVLAALSGCASIPDMGPLGMPRPDLMSDGVLKNDSVSYPQADWWTLYGDPQLNALIEEGLCKSPTIEEANARLLKADALAQQAGAPLLPHINANGYAQKYRQSYNNGVPAAYVPHGFQNFAEALLNFEYEIDFWGKYRDGLSAAISEAQSAELETAQARVVLSTSIAATYANLAQLYAELDAAKKAVNVRSKTVELFEKRFENGLENKGGVEQARSMVAKSELEVAVLEESIDLLHNSLAALVGMTPFRGLLIRPPSIASSQLFKIPAELPADLIARRPDLIAARMRLEAAAYNINVAKAGFYPNVNLKAFVGYQSLGFNALFNSSSLTSAVGPAIHLPIFTAGRLEGKYREAWADYTIRLAQYESAIIQALHEVANALTSQNALGYLTKKTKEALDASEIAYKVIDDRYRGGIATYLEVLSAESTLIAARRAMAVVQSRAFVLDVALAKALGGGFKPICIQKEKDL